MTAKIAGYTELLNGFKLLPRVVERGLRDELRKSGDIVKTDWAYRITKGAAASPSIQRTASGLRTYVRMRGVIVEQSIRKTTGRRADFGRWQMRRGIPALNENQAEIIARIVAMVERTTAQTGM